jgi:hypothetical protein
MKNIVAFTLIVLLISCTKTPESCHYNLDNTEDSSLYISYLINNVKYVYYQNYDPSALAIESSLILKNQKVYNTYYRLKFDELGWNGAQYTENSTRYHPYVELLINDTIMITKYISISSPIPPLSQVLRESYKFSIPKTLQFPSEISSYDPIYFPSVSITVYMDDIGYSTEFLVNHFDFSADSLTKYLWKDSNFKITNREDVCNNLKLVTGEFNTTVTVGYIYNPIKIENGHFRILIK